MQPRIFLNLLFFRTGGAIAGKYHNYQLQHLLGFRHVYNERKPVIWQYQLQPPIFSMLLSLFHWSTWSDPLCQGHCIYFTTLIALIHYNKRSVDDSRKLEGYCIYLRKAIVVLLLRTNCSNFCWKCTVLSTQKHFRRMWYVLMC